MGVGLMDGLWVGSGHDVQAIQEPELIQKNSAPSPQSTARRTRRGHGGAGARQRCPAEAPRGEFSGSVCPSFHAALSQPGRDVLVVGNHGGHWPRPLLASLCPGPCPGTACCILASAVTNPPGCVHLCPRMSQLVLEDHPPLAVPHGHFCCGGAVWAVGRWRRLLGPGPMWGCDLGDEGSGVGVLGGSPRCGRLRLCRGKCVKAMWRGRGLRGWEGPGHGVPELEGPE